MHDPRENISAITQWVTEYKYNVREKNVKHATVPREPTVERCSLQSYLPHSMGHDMTE